MWTSTDAHTALHSDALPSSQWHHTSGLLLIDVWYLSHGGGHHPDGVAPTELHLIPDELLPESLVGPHDGSAGPHPPVGLQEGGAAVLHQIGHAQGGGAAHTGVAVHQRAAAALRGEPDLIRHLVKVVAERRPRGVRDRDVDVLLHPWRRRAAALSNVHDAGYVAPSQLGGIISRSAITEVQMVGDPAQAWQTCTTRLMHAGSEIYRCSEVVSLKRLQSFPVDPSRNKRLSAVRQHRKAKCVWRRTLSPPAGWGLDELHKTADTYFYCWGCASHIW